MDIKLADRIKNLPPYLFAELDRLKAEQVAKGADVIDLGVGDPDRPTPDHIVASAKEAVADPSHHQYPSYVGMLSFRQAASHFLKKRFGVAVDPQTEVVSMIGTKEGIAHFPLAFLNPGDALLYTSPGYPVYPVSAMFAGGEGVPIPLTQENNFLPALESIPAELADRAVLFFVNYPNNPTSKMAPASFYEKLIDFAQAHNVIIASDAAYSEMYDGNEAPPSILQFPRGKEVAVEFHSLSKTYNMTGWRVGFAAGRAELIQALGKVKTNIDSGIFEAVQEAGITALEGDQSCVASMRDLYSRRRQLMHKALEKAGMQIACSEGAFYIWVKTPEGFTSQEFSRRVLEEAAVVCTPGNGFGAEGEGYVRFALSAPDERLEEAGERISKLEL